MESLMELVFTISLLGLAFAPLIVPFLGYRWTRRSFGSRLSRIFLWLMGVIVVFAIVFGYLTMSELAEAGAWTAAALTPFHVVTFAFPIMLVITLVWVATLWLYRKVANA